MSVYTFDDRRVHPKEYTLIDSDNIKIEFDEPINGYVVLVDVGDLSMEGLLEELEGLVEEVSWVAYKHNDIGEPEKIAEGDNTIVYKDDNYYYFDIKLNKDDEYIINEFELYDVNGYDEHKNNLLFHSIMSDLYKPPGVDFTMHYRLEIPSGN